MHVLEFILAGFVAFLVCAYFQVPIVVWTIVAAAFGWWLSAAADFGQTTNVVHFDSSLSSDAPTYAQALRMPPVMS